MAMGPTLIDDMPGRMDAVEASLRAAPSLSGRVIERSLLRGYDEHPPADLAKGVIILISAGESGYRAGGGMVAREGVHRMQLVCRLKVGESATPLDVERMELAMAEEIKAWARTGVDGIGLAIEKIQHSRQLAHPYGWLVVDINAGPPGQTTY